MNDETKHRQVRLLVSADRMLQELVENFFSEYERDLRAEGITSASDPQVLELIRDAIQERYEQTLARSR